MRSRFHLAPAGALLSSLVALSLGPAAATPAGSPAVSVPRAYRGEWDTRLSDCRLGENEGWIRVNRDTVDMYEAPAARVVGVERHGGDNVTLSLAMESEGHRWVERRRLRLVSGGQGMVDYVDKRTRFRCPGR
jgi:hypothetical protein